MSDVLQLLVDRIDTQIGVLFLVADDDGNLRAADWTDHEARMQHLMELQYGKNRFSLESTHNLKELKGAIGNYFSGELAAIDILPVQTAGTLFQREVWSALRKIPCGTTISYGKLAEQIGRPCCSPGSRSR